MEKKYSPFTLFMILNYFVLLQKALLQKIYVNGHKPHQVLKSEKRYPDKLQYHFENALTNPADCIRSLNFLENRSALTVLMLQSQVQGITCSYILTSRHTQMTTLLHCG